MSGILFFIFASCHPLIQRQYAWSCNDEFPNLIIALQEKARQFKSEIEVPSFNE